MSINAIQARLLCVINSFSFRKDCEHELDKLQDLYHKLNHTAMQLDWEADLDLIKGNECQRPLSYYHEKGGEVVREARFIVMNLRLVFNAIQLNDCTTIESYKKAFKVGDDFLDLLSEFYVFASIFIKNNKRI